MSFNTGFFAAYNYRRKQPPVGHRTKSTNQQPPYLKGPRSSVDSINSTESFLPLIPTSNNSNNGHRPYRRNDFANNHVFVAKQKLARLFLNQPPTSVQSTDDLVHLFDHEKSKLKTHKKNNKKQQQDKNSDGKSTSTSTLDQDVHVSVVNLVLKPSVPSSRTNDALPILSHRSPRPINFQTRAPRPSIEWINPAITEHLRSQASYIAEDEFEANTIINEMLNKQSNPLDSSVLYVKSILHIAGTQ